MSTKACVSLISIGDLDDWTAIVSASVKGYQQAIHLLNREESCPIDAMLMT